MGFKKLIRGWLKAHDEVISNHSGRLLDFGVAIAATNRRIDELAGLDQEAVADQTDVTKHLEDRIDAQARTITELEKGLCEIKKVVFPAPDMVPAGDTVDKPKTMRRWVAYDVKNFHDGPCIVGVALYRAKPRKSDQPFGLWIDFPVDDQ